MEWLNYHHLFYFWTVVREGSITGAGKQLRLAPSTISAQLSRLEEILGNKLFLRTGRKLELTELGRVVHRYADEIFSLGRELVDTVRGRAAAGPLHLKIGVVDVMPKRVARKLLEPALSLSEPLRLVCREGKIDPLIAALSVHDLDMVLADAPARPGSGFRVFNHLLGECGVTFFAAKKLARSLKAGFPKSLNGAPVLLPTEMTALRSALDSWFESTGVQPVIRGEFDDSDLLKVFGQEGDGVFASPTVIESEVQQQYRVEVIGRSTAVRERFYAISVERILKHPAVVAISNAARDRLFAVE